VRAPKTTTSAPAGVDALDDPRLTLVGLFAESFAGLRVELEQRLRRECGLSLQRFVLLLRLARSPDRRLRMSDLADQTNLTPSGLTRAIDRMEADGLVQRVACEDDRRGAYAALTDAGLERIAGAVGPHLRHLDDAFMSVISVGEQDDLERILRKLRDRVNPGAARPPEPI
jgi:MarR family transcriptional regulator, 2-MHQ and catechol-resistance regulon repressor